MPVSHRLKRRRSAVLLLALSTLPPSIGHQSSLNRPHPPTAFTTLTHPTKLNTLYRWGLDTTPDLTNVRPSPATSSISPLNLEKTSTLNLNLQKSSGTTTTPPPSSKEAFLLTLTPSPNDNLITTATPSRTASLSHLVTTTPPPNLLSLLPPTAPSERTSGPAPDGRWNVVYAPHMTTMARVAGGGEFRVEYLLNGDGTMESHARLEFPWMGLAGVECVYLSVSGTYGSVDDTVCRVDFDKAWIKTISARTTQPDTTSTSTTNDDGPYPFLDDVPDSLSKNVITTLGNLFFVDSVSVFPVSYWDTDLVVFDFELLGTRICARKVG